MTQYILQSFSNAGNPFMMTSDRSSSRENEILLDLSNFPADFVDGRHPDDGKFLDNPIAPEYVIFQGNGKLRLFLRISFRLLVENQVRYFPLSFIVDTGAMGSFYFAPYARKILADNNRIVTNGDQVSWIPLQYGPNNQKKFRATVYTTSDDLLPANLIGLALLKKLGFHLSNDGWHFDESRPFF